jgi:sigma-B regulation protein RsbU (phosphoserine phosphatase)
VGSPGAATTTFGRAGSLIGVLDDPFFDQVSLPLADQQTLVLYTDGVTEARRGAEFYGEDRLCGVVAQAQGPVHDLTAAVLDAVLDFQGGRPRDDIAVVALRAEPVREPGRDQVGGASPGVESVGAPD